MPTNVSPEYAAAEREYQKATTIPEKLNCLEKMLSTCPTHKGCEKLRAEIKSRISRLKEKLKKEKEQKRKSPSLAVKKEGAAQIVLVGLPNTGKTSLINVLAKTNYEVAPYPFTTNKPNLGIFSYQKVRLQIVDLPPLIKEAASKQAPLFAIIRNADLVLLVIDSLDQVDFLLQEFWKNNLLLNKTRPPLHLKKEASGGLIFIGKKLIKDNLKKIEEILRKEGFLNATIKVYGPVKLNDFQEVLKEGLVYLPALLVLNKKNQKDFQEKRTFFYTSKLPFFSTSFEVVPFSLTPEINLDLLKEKIWQKLNLIRIYTKEPGKKPSLKEPFPLPKGSTIKELASSLHQDFLKRFKYARVWGGSVKHPSQIVGLNHRLEEGDIVEIHLK